MYEIKLLFFKNYRNSEESTSTKEQIPKFAEAERTVVCKKKSCWKNSLILFHWIISFNIAHNATLKFADKLKKFITLGNLFIV